MRSRQAGLALGFLAVFVFGPTAGCNYSFAVIQVEKVCDNGKDDDGDGLVDCFDPDCATQPSCHKEKDCTDGVDNDADGQTDCADLDCAQDPDCQGETVCWDGQDDDGDGLTDCDDEECANQVPCLNARYGCDKDGTCEEMPEGWTGDATSWEDQRWCSDCQVSCSLEDSGDPYDYIATRVELPLPNQGTGDIGYNLDGDPSGNVDNDLSGALFYLTQSGGEDPQADADSLVQSGRYILLGRLVVDSWPNDDSVLVQIFDGNTDPTADATEDNLTGDGQVLIAPTAPRQMFLCGTLSEGSLLAGPGRIRLPLPLFYETLYVTLDPAWVLTESDGYVTETEWKNVIIAGGIDQNGLDNELFPELARYLSQRYKKDPTTGLADFIRSSVDGRCGNSNPGCEDVVNGEGDCVVYDGTNDPVVTTTEVKCSLLGAYFAPTTEVVQSDGTVAKVYTMGFRITAVHVRILN